MALSEEEIRIIEAFEVWIPNLVREGLTKWNGFETLSQKNVLKGACEIIGISYDEGATWIKMFRHAQIQRRGMRSWPAYFPKGGLDSEWSRRAWAITKNKDRRYRKAAANVCRWYEAADFKRICEVAGKLSKGYNEYNLDGLKLAISRELGFVWKYWARNLAYVWGRYDTTPARSYEEIAELLRSNRSCVKLAREAMSEYSLVQYRAVNSALDEVIEYCLKTGEANRGGARVLVAKKMGTDPETAGRRLYELKCNLEGTLLDNIRNSKDDYTRMNVHTVNYPRTEVRSVRT